MEIGTIVVRKQDEFSEMVVGDMATIKEDGGNNLITTYLKEFNYRHDVRKMREATKNEQLAFRNRCRNIKDIDKYLNKEVFYEAY